MWIRGKLFESINCKNISVIIIIERKVSLIAFNPLAEDVLASTSVDYSIQVWNMIKSETYSLCKINGKNRYKW